jgi:hypothetical protein
MNFSGSMMTPLSYKVDPKACELQPKVLPKSEHFNGKSSFEEIWKNPFPNMVKSEK